MRFYVVERVRTGVSPESKEFAKTAVDYLKYMAKLQKKGKVIRGPCLDILGNGYILETKNIEERGEIFSDPQPTSCWTGRSIPLAASWTRLKA